MSATKDQFFKKTASAGKDKASVTDDAAKSIVAAEAIAREKKTKALRALRLEQQAASEQLEVKSAKEPKSVVRRGRA
ncbi:hypothetical protein HGP17_27285 [Rhizobium sp. P38BS-XIX]|uniref:hypothetical protein n=1 Tax=Rhizobium sp. P38BS-XIX TaxID=2726740 RepID=UPI0014563443|nr:hypothetical protein [Rhizobium sp. P38BS-XIX]NLS00550.1 hypothetical protein [Rhizobium sp. P38BS-XIX]